MFKMVKRALLQFFLGSRNRGISEKWPFFQKYPDFSAPEKLRWGALDHFKDRAKLRRFWKFQTILPAYTDFYRLLRIPNHKSGGILWPYFLILKKNLKWFLKSARTHCAPKGFVHLHSHGFGVIVLVTRVITIYYQVFPLLVRSIRRPWPYPANGDRR